jgi:hypothetical protein
MRVIKIAFLFLVLSSVAVPAATISFRSGDGPSTEWNNLGPNVLVALHPVWVVDPAGGQWVSFGQTGWAGPDRPVNSLSVPYATFTEEFYLPGDSNSGIIDVWADDTASVYLNGARLNLASFILGFFCADSGVGCVPAQVGHYSVTSPLLVQGLNYLTIEAYQVGGDTAGVLYSGSITSTLIPEPGAAVMLAIGLAGFGLLRLRRR